MIYPNYDKFPPDTDPSDIQKAVRHEINQLNKKLAGFKQIHAVEIRTTPFEKTTSRKIKRHLVK